MDAGLRARLAGIRDAARDGDVRPASGVEGRWLEHCRELRDRVTDLVRQGGLVFQRSGGEPTPVTDLGVARTILLGCTCT